MSLTILEVDLTKLDVDAVVNAANSALMQGGGVCGAIFAAAGAKELWAACGKLGGCPTGQAVLTPGFRLPARFIIHTVGPVWRGGMQGEEALLRSCYRNSLALAASHKLSSVAFPLISAGIYGYPGEAALSVAVSEIQRFLEDHPMEVTLALFDRGIYRLAQQNDPELCR